MFRTHLDHLASGRGADWAAMFTEDAVLEFPYAPEGYPTQVVGRANLLAHHEAFARNFRVTFADVRFHDTVDDTRVVAELDGEGVALATGRPYRQKYVCFIETRDGQISRYVDYWNPQVVADALGGGNDDVVSAFSE
jgi:uncharacterized protein